MRIFECKNDENSRGENRIFCKNISGPCLALMPAVEDGGGEEEQPEAEQEAEAVHQAAWASMRSLSAFCGDLKHMLNKVLIHNVILLRRKKVELFIKGTLLMEV